jgi:DNA-binding transcriptional LysR family regulator
MRIFVRIAQEGSFTGAASRLNITTANASRAVSQLESHLRTRLLNRSTRRIALTEAGQRYLDRCERILAYVEEVEAEAAVLWRVQYEMEQGMFVARTARTMF